MVEVHGEKDQRGNRELVHSENLPSSNGNTETVLGIQEGQILVIS